LQGPWRVRSWQTFLLLINAFVLPIVFKRTFGRLPWGFIAITVLFFVGLYIATYILFYLQDKVPMGTLFSARKAQPGAESQSKAASEGTGSHATPLNGLGL
jgi:hypothetical protein